MSSHMGPMYIETPYSRGISIPMYIKTPYIIISRGISSLMGPMYIETPYSNSSSVISCYMGPVYFETPYVWDRTWKDEFRLKS